MRVISLICLATVLTTSARAHDPYEVTSVAYLYSNRIELFMEMEFPTGLTLAGQKPVRDVAVVSQFEAALPRLRELAGGFFAFTAGNNVVQPLSTNVELGVENHIRFQVNFAPTPYRPLKFGARGLGENSSENPYGTSLTVLDMVNQKVLGQATLFAATPTTEFPPPTTESPDRSPATTESNPPAATIAAPLPPQSTSAAFPVPTSPARKPNWLLALVTLSAVFLITFAFFRRRE